MIAFHRKRAIIYSIGALAQLGARYIRIVEAVGSNPICSTAAGPGGIRDLFYTLRSRIFISLIYSEIKLWILLILFRQFIIIIIQRFYQFRLLIRKSPRI